MKKLPDIVKHVSLDSIGELTGQRYAGSFRIKVLLTHSERLAVDRTYAMLLPDDKSASQESKLKAGGIAELDQRIVEAPKWWLDARNGRDLVDAQPIWDLLIAVEQKTEEWKQDLGKKAEDEDASTQQ